MARVYTDQHGKNNPNWKGGTGSIHYKNHHRRPGAIAANRRVLRALKSGKLKKSPCEACGELKVEAHHDDYSKPLSVRWLCKKHHNLADRHLL